MLRSTSQCSKKAEMADNFDELEKSVMEEAKRIYTEKTVEHATNPQNAGELPEANGFGRLTGTCQDTIEVWLKVQANKIARATFWTNGCGATIATSDAACKLAMGKTVPEALQITPKNVIEYLGGLPEESVHCAVLAVNTLKTAIMDYISRASEPPWKTLYRKDTKEK